MGKKVKLDESFKDPTKTDIRVTVLEKYEAPFLRYDARKGTVKNDVHFVTLFKLPTGEVLTSYSKTLFAQAKVGKSYKIKVSYCHMPNEQYLLYAGS